MKGKRVVSSPCKKILIICSGLYALSTSSQAKIIHLFCVIKTDDIGMVISATLTLTLTLTGDVPQLVSLD